MTVRIEIDIAENGFICREFSKGYDCDKSFVFKDVLDLARHVSIRCNREKHKGKLT